MIVIRGIQLFPIKWRGDTFDVRKALRIKLITEHRGSYFEDIIY